MPFKFFRTQNKKVDFLIAGTQKGGTTALDYYLRQHPDIGMAYQKKEVHFFDKDKFFTRSKVDYSYYLSFFDLKENKKVYGEATPVYMYWEPSIKRIWEYNKDMKLLIVLRNPIDRAFSHWNMEMDRGNETEDFFYCIENESRRLESVLPLQSRVFSYVDRGFYSTQIKRILSFFDREQLLFVKYEDFYKNQEMYLNKVFTFLGVDYRHFMYVPKKIHTRPYVKTMSIEEREYLAKVFCDDIKEVEYLLNWNCSDWV